MLMYGILLFLLCLVCFAVGGVASRVLLYHWTSRELRSFWVPFLETCATAHPDIIEQPPTWFHLWRPWLLEGQLGIRTTLLFRPRQIDFISRYKVEYSVGILPIDAEDDVRFLARGTWLLSLGSSAIWLVSAGLLLGLFMSIGSAFSQPVGHLLWYVVTMCSMLMAGMVGTSMLTLWEVLHQKKTSRFVSHVDMPVVRTGDREFDSRFRVLGREEDVLLLFDDDMRRQLCGLPQEVGVVVDDARISLLLPVGEESQGIEEDALQRGVVGVLKLLRKLQNDGVSRAKGLLSSFVSEPKEEVRMRYLRVLLIRFPRTHEAQDVLRLAVEDESSAIRAVAEAYLRGGESALMGGLSMSVERDTQGAVSLEQGRELGGMALCEKSSQEV